MYCEVPKINQTKSVIIRYLECVHERRVHFTKYRLDTHKYIPHRIPATISVSSVDLTPEFRSAKTRERGGPSVKTVEQ